MLRLATPGYERFSQATHLTATFEVVNQTLPYPLPTTD